MINVYSWPLYNLVIEGRVQPGCLGWTRDGRSILAPLCHSPQEGREGEGVVVTAVVNLPKLEELTLPPLFMVLTDQQLQLSVCLPLL